MISGGVYLASCLCLVFVSGLTALVYQITLQSYLSQFLGSHALAATLALSSFFLWLSVGYLVIGRNAHRFVRNKLLLYGILEGLIGIWCLLSPWLFDGLFALFVPLLGGSAPELLVGLAFTALFAAPPTVLMGGTIPVLTDALAFEFSGSHRSHALIYGTNTAGAFAGALLGGFFLVERLGLPGTLHAIALANLGLFGITWVVSRISTRSERVVAPDTGGGEAKLPAATRTLLMTQSFLSGFYVFSLENLTIRMAGIVLGTSTYTYSIVVACFILAIAAGSLGVALFRRISGLRFFLAVQILLCAALVGLYLSVPEWPALMLRARTLVYPALLNFGFYWTLVLCVFLGILLVPVGLMGMNLPLLFNHLRNRRQYFSQVVGQIYAVNTAGSAIGAVVGGYWLFHYLEGHQVFKVSATAVALTLPLLIWLFAAGTPRLRALGLVPLLIVPALWRLPEWPEHRFVPGLFTYQYPLASQAAFGPFLEEARRTAARDFRIRFTRHDPDGVVHVVDDPGSAGRPPGRGLYVNGKTDAHTPRDSAVRSLYALVPLSLARRPEKVFIIGLGAGLSSSIAIGFDEVRRVRVAEISEGVIEALAYFEDTEARLDAERDKLEILRGDAYRLLLADRQRYDLILAQPSNTWVAGVGKLFSQEFYRIAEARLRDGGLFAQWLNPQLMDDVTLRALLSTFRSVFPSVSIWDAAGALVLIGSRETLDPDPASIARRFEEQREIYVGLGLDHPLAVLGLQLAPPALVTRIADPSGPLERLEKPMLTYRAGRSMFAMVNASLGRLAGEALRQPLEPGTAAHFVLDRHPRPLPAAFFRAAEAHRARYGLPRARLQILRDLHHPHSPERRTAEPLLRQFGYLLEETAGGPGDLGGLITAYDQLRRAQFAVDPRRVAGPVERACDEGPCGDLAYRLLRTRFSDAELRERGIEALRDWSQAPAALRESILELLSEAFPS